MVGNNTNQLSWPAAVFICSLAVIMISHFSGLDFGIIGVFSWIVFLGGIVGFLAKVYYGDL